MNLNWAKQWAEAWNTANSEKVLSMYTDDILFEDLFFGLKLEGKEQLSKANEAYFSPTAPFKSSNEATDYLGDDTGGVICWTWHFTPGSTFMGHNVEGKSCHIPGFSMLQFRDGQIYKERDIVDGITVAEALGILEKRPSGNIDPLSGHPEWKLVFSDNHQ